MGAVAELLEMGKSIKQGLDDANKRIDDAAKRRNTGADAPFGVPAVRKGDSVLSSSGFRVGKMLAAICNPADQHFAEAAKNELAYSRKLCGKMYGMGWRPDNSASSQLMPIWPEAFSEDTISDADYKEMYEYLGAGIAGADPDEMRWHGKRWDFYGVRGNMGYRGKAAEAASPAMSWVDQSVGGSFVAPPTFGPPIELLRNKAVMMRAGATTVPLGPSGRIQMSRLTSATQGGWSGENQVNASVNAGTGLMTLSAKKVIALVAFPNELLRFGSPAAEAMIRNDLFTTVSLIADKGMLDGPGSDNVPLGLATMGSKGFTSPLSTPSAGSSGLNDAGINVVTPTNSNQLAPQDWYEFLSAIEEQNGEPTVWIMRPKMYYAAQKSRWTPYSGGTSQGGFTFDMTRALGDNLSERGIVGLPVVRSPQVSKTRGSGSQTYVICMNGPDYLFGMFGAIEFTQSNQGRDLISSDQTLVRAILTCDGGPRHPANVSFADSLSFVVAG